MKTLPATSFITSIEFVGIGFMLYEENKNFYLDFDDLCGRVVGTPVFIV